VGVAVIVTVFGATAVHIVPPQHGRNSSASAVALESLKVIKREPSPVIFEHLEALQTLLPVDTSTPEPVAASFRDELMPAANSNPSALQAARATRGAAPAYGPSIQLPRALPRKRRTDESPRPTIDASASSADSGQLDKVPVAIYSPRPEYPAKALAAAIEGRVLLRVELNHEGHVTRTTVAESSGHKILDEAAQRSVAKWRFEPATRLGVRVTAEVALPVVFDYLAP